MTISRVAANVLRKLLDDYFRHQCPGWQSDDAGLDERNLVEFLFAALESTRSTSPLMGYLGPMSEADFESRRAVVSALFAMDNKSPEACLDAFFDALAIDVAEGSQTERTPRAVPRVYCWQPLDWPAVLGISVGGGGAAWFDSVFGVVAETGWMDDTAERAQVFTAIRPDYSQLAFFEIGRFQAFRLACFLFAGPERKLAFNAFGRKADAFVALFGKRTRFFSNRAWPEDEIQEPFAHGETVDLGTESWCAGGTLLLLLATDGHHVVRLDALWDTWTET